MQTNQGNKHERTLWMVLTNSLILGYSILLLIGSSCVIQRPISKSSILCREPCGCRGKQVEGRQPDGRGSVCCTLAYSTC